MSELIAQHILIDETLLTSPQPLALLNAAQEFAAWALNDAYLMPGEFPLGALFVANLEFYVAQIENGGHWQFARNSRMEERLLNRILNCLHLVGAQDFFQVFTDFLTCMTAEPERIPAALRSDYKARPPQIDQLDQRFFALDREILLKKAEDWIRSLPTFRPLGAQALADAKAAVIAANLEFAARQGAQEAARSALLAANPAHVAAKKLCAAAGYQFLGFTAGFRVLAPFTLGWGLRATEGVFKMLVGPESAELRDFKTGALIAQVSMTSDSH